MVQRFVWLDVDPGHDDATAIMLALHSPNVTLLGVSTTHGNASSEHTAINAARCLVAFHADPSIKVYPGAPKPLLRPVKHDPEIHGDDGLGGVEGLPLATDPRVQARFVRDEDEETKRALDGMSQTIRTTWKKGSGSKVTVVSTGPMTNIALFVSVYPELVDAIEEFVFMGGGVGVGNRSAVAEYNILCDPHATQMVLNVPVKKTMIPLNVTHTAIFTKQRQSELLSPGSTFVPNEPLPQPTSKLRHTLSTLVTFFADAYKSTFGFHDGPPLHDALTIAYLSQPDLFKVKRYKVDVELTGTHSIGETIVDMWNYQNCDENSWGNEGKNCLVAEYLEVDRFFTFLLECVTRCESEGIMIVT